MFDEVNSELKKILNTVNIIVELLKLKKNEEAYRLLVSLQKEVSLQVDVTEGYFTTKEAASFLGVSEKTILRRIKASELVAEKTNKGYLFSKKELKKFKEDSKKSFLNTETLKMLGVLKNE